MLMLDNWWTSILPIPAFLLTLLALEIRHRVLVYRRTVRRNEAMRLKAAARAWAMRKAA